MNGFGLSHINPIINPPRLLSNGHFSIYAI